MLNLHRGSTQHQNHWNRRNLRANKFPSPQPLASWLILSRPTGQILYHESPRGSATDALHTLSSSLSGPLLYPHQP